MEKQGRISANCVFFLFLMFPDIFVPACYRIVSAACSVIYRDHFQPVQWQGYVTIVILVLKVVTLRLFFF